MKFLIILLVVWSFYINSFGQSKLFIQLTDDVKNRISNRINEIRNYNRNYLPYLIFYPSCEGNGLNQIFVGYIEQLRNSKLKTFYKSTNRFVKVSGLDIPVIYDSDFRYCLIDGKQIMVLGELYFVEFNLLGEVLRDGY